MVAASVERLLAALDDSPGDAADLIFAALSARGWAGVSDALTNDPRFVRWLLPAFRDPRIRKQVPSLSRIMARHRIFDAIDDLLIAWKNDDKASAANAGFAILELGERESITAVARDAPKRSGAERQCSFRAAFALTPETEAYDLLAGDLEQDAFAESLFVFLANNDERAAKDPRWAQAASGALATRNPEVARAARRALVKLAGEEAALHAEAGRPPTPSAAVAKIPDAEVARARHRIERALGRLATSGVECRPPADAALISELESLVGPLPPAVRALYETCDGLRVESDPPHEIYPLAVALAAAKRWVHSERPGEASGDLVRPFELPVAPDSYTLRGLSGGPDLAVMYPWKSADPKMLHAPRSPRFSTLVNRAVKAAL